MAVEQTLQEGRTGSAEWNLRHSRGELKYEIHDHNPKDNDLVTWQRKHQEKEQKREQLHS